MVFPYFLSTEEIAIHVLEAFNWCLRRASRPPRSLPADYCELCLDFILSDAKEAIRDFCIPEKVQVVFYAMMVNEAYNVLFLKLGCISIGIVSYGLTALGHSIREWGLAL